MRQHSRVTFRSMFRIKVYDAIKNLMMGYVGDVSETGLRLLSDTLMEVGRQRILRLKMRVREDEVLQLDIQVVCMWARENDKTGNFESGFTLVNQSAEYAKLVGDLLALRERASK
jgi:hypothetical protein